MKELDIDNYTYPQIKEHTRHQCVVKEREKDEFEVS